MNDERLTCADNVRTRPAILLVDDEPNVVEALAIQLRRQYQVSITTSPVEALALAREQRFDAVVSDLRMPVMGGVELLREIRLAAPATARLLLTGQGDLESAAAAVNQANVHAVMLKPCPASDLADAIQRALASMRSLDGDAVVELGQRAALGAMAGAIGHEIGNLAVALGGSIAALHEQTEQGDIVSTEDVALLSVINGRLTEHARHLRDLAKPKTLDFANIDVSQVLVETVGLLQKAGVLRFVPVATDIGAVPPIAHADRAAVEGILMNLLKNATEAVEEHVIGGLATGAVPAVSRIIARVFAEGDLVTIEIEDAGPGIAAERLPRIYEPHRSTKGSRGTGLGLGIVRTAVERQGGRIAIQSVLGVGTIVRVQLPRAQAARAS